MSNSSWIRPLKQAARSLAKNRNRPARIALVGIGNEINGDDGAGVQIVRGLGQKLPEKSERMSPICGEWLFVEAGQAPENFSGTLRKFQPDLVVLVDAADMGQSAGSVACLDWRKAGGWSASTHSLPLNMLSAFLVSELDCEVMMLGIQPVEIGMGQPLSRQVELAAEEIIAELESWMSKGK